LRQYAMLVRPPFGELRQIVDHLLAVGVEDVRAVLVVENPGLVRLVVSVAADMVAPIDEKDSRAMLRRQPFSKNGAGKTGSDDQIIIAADAAILGAHSAATSSAGVPV